MGAFDACSRITQEMKESLVSDHAIMVKRIAYHLFRKVPQVVQLDDLIQAGMLGLLEAVNYYDSDKGASFSTYATIRIRGHMLDEIRRNDWLPRSVYRNARMISEAVKHVENRLGREAKDHEVAEELQLSIDEYHDMLKDSACGQLYNFDDVDGIGADMLKFHDGGESTEPHTYAQQQDIKNQLRTIMKQLPEKERLVLSMYYDQDLNLKEIGMILGISESRVCQIHSQATLHIRAKL